MRQDRKPIRQQTEEERGLFAKFRREQREIEARIMKEKERKEKARAEMNLCNTEIELLRTELVKVNVSVRELKRKVIFGEEE